MRKLADTYDWSSDPGRADHADQSNKIICTDAQLSHNGVAPLNSDVGAIMTPGEYRGMQKKPATRFNTLTPRVGCRCRSRQVLLKTVPAFFHLTRRVALLPCLFLGLCVSLAAQVPAVERIVLPAVYRYEVEKSAESSNNQLRTDRARIYTASGKTYRVWAEFDITALKGKAICGVGLRVYNNDAASHINGLRYCSVRPSTAGGSLLNQQTGFSRKYQGFTLDLAAQAWTPDEASFFQPSREDWIGWKRDANHPGSGDHQTLIEDLRDQVADPDKTWFALGFSCSGCGSEGNLVPPAGDDDPASIVLEVLTQSISIDAQETSNRNAHRTAMYETQDYQVVRRYGLGLSEDGGYRIVVNQGFPHNPNHRPKFLARTLFEGMVHEIEIPIVEGEIDPDAWCARLEALADGDRQLTWLINIPRKAPVGRYKFAYLLELGEGADTAVYEAGFPKQVAVLFNPMSPADAEVYLEDQVDLGEYILADKGLMWTYSLMTGDIPKEKEWNYSQFKPIALETVLGFFDQLDMDSRISAAAISRHLTEMVNEEEDHGILVGAWLGEWYTQNDGTDPLKWGNSEDILLQYRESGPVKYAQCYVYAGLLTTLLRCIGIPSRPVVCQDSGIDADVPPNKVIRLFVVGDVPIVTMDSDLLWSYHIWCEAQVATANHVGWHVLDGTPMYFDTVREGATHRLSALGPVPIDAVKSKTGGSYDIDYVISEVDADLDFSDGLGNNRGINPNYIGKRIFTKAKMENTIMELTESYKLIPPNKRLGPAAKMQEPVETDLLPSGIAVKFFNPYDPVMGRDLVWRLELQNTLKNPLAVSAAYSVFGKDNNVTQIDLNFGQQTTELGPAETRMLEFEVTQADYLPATASSREIQLIPFVRVEGAADFFTTYRGKVHLAQPEIEITVMPGIDVSINDLVTVEARFANPLAVPLHGARMRFAVTDGLSIDGARVKEFDLGTIPVGQEMIAQAEVRGVGIGSQWLSVFTGADELVTKQETVDLVVMDGPGIVFPLPGSRLDGAQQTFNWSAAGLPIEDWRLTIGSTVGGDELYDSGALGPVLVDTANDLPADGRPLFVTLAYALDGVWTWLNYRYLAAGNRPALVAPDHGAALPGERVTFRWQPNDALVADWRLLVGSNLGGDDYFDSGVLPPLTLEAVAEGLPRDGSSVFARLYYTIEAVEYFCDARYTAFKLPELTSPLPGSALPGSAVPFTWTANNSTVTAWRLQVGTEVGGSDLYDSGILHTTEYTAHGLPTGGETVHIRFSFQIDGVFQWKDYLYTTGLGPMMIEPIPGGSLPGFAATFVWTANGAAIDAWRLQMGRSTYVDTYESGTLGGNVLSAQVNGLPTDGSQVIAFLGYRLQGGGWHYLSYHFNGAVDGGGPELLSPEPGTILPGFSAELKWTGHEETIANWQIQAGTGAPFNLYNVILDGDVFETVINGLPTDGQPVDIYLGYELIGGKWHQRHYSFTSSTVPGGPSISSPLPGSLLPGATTTFTWTANGESISGWELDAGTGPTAADIYQSGPLASDVFAATVSSLPPAGTRVRVRLTYGLLGGASQSRVFEFNNPPIVMADVPDQELFLIPEPGTAVIRNENEWTAFAESYWTGQDQNGRTPPPTVDFNENMVIAVYFGSGFSGCDSRVAVIQDVGFADGNLQVTVAPLPDLGNCRAELSPLHLVAVPKLEIPVTFVGQVP